MRRRARIANEDGIALIAAICSLGLMITLGSIALQQAVAALRHSGEQAHVKRALQAADAAIDSATFHVERADIGGTLKIDPLNPTSLTGQNCVVTVSGVAGMDIAALDPATAVDPAGNKWCPESGAETTGENATFTYRLSQLLRAGAGPCGTGSLLTLDRDVVAVGRSGGVTRRVKARLRANIALLSGAAVQSSSTVSPLTMSGTARVLGDVASNHDITGVGGLNVIAGKATTRASGSITGVVPAGATGQACESFTLPDVVQGDVTTVNDNASRSSGCVVLATMLPVACSLPLVGTTGGAVYNAANRSLRVYGNGRVILTGANYSFCSIRLEGQGILQISNSSPLTRIFIDDPDNCRDAGTGNLIAGAGTIKVDGEARIANCHSQTKPESLQIYAAGNSTISTTQTFEGGSMLTGALRSTLCGINLPVIGEPMTIVAPHSTLSIGGSTAIAGQVAGEVVHLSGAAAINPINALVNLNQLGSKPVLPLYKPTKYVECTGRSFATLPAADPAQGC